MTHSLKLAGLASLFLFLGSFVAQMTVPLLRPKETTINILFQKLIMSSMTRLQSPMEVVQQLKVVLFLIEQYIFSMTKLINWILSQEILSILVTVFLWLTFIMCTRINSMR
ncbi:hypothetical protein ACPDHJ_13610 [Myroides sp. C8-3]|uniref:hypothetical protein n=1 Tax=Myroides sp. C8-3 TaxID=3400533 RepID=UPI003D2F8B6B